MLYLIVSVLFSFGSEHQSVQFSSSAQQETTLWEQSVEAFISKNPQAQLLTKDSIQALYVPASSPTAPLLILSSGIHGAEAFAGSALQRLFLQKWQVQPRTSGLLLIHILNPHGFSEFRRTNANNIDLNRNFFSEPLPTNPAYQNMQFLLEPQTPACTSLLSKWIFFLKVGYFYLKNGKKEILKTLSGQNQSPKGLYFSGTENQNETLIVQSWVLQTAKNFSTVVHIDLHTGFGERGKLHLFGSEEFRKPQQLKLLSQVFPNVKIDTANDDAFYPTHGDFIDWTWKALPNKTVIPMVFEFGTMDSQTLLGGMESLWISVIENQGFHFGYKTDNDKQKTHKFFESLFNPQEEVWKKKVLEQGLKELEKTLQALEKIN